MSQYGYMRRLDLEDGVVDMQQGAGGRASHQLIADLFAKAFTNEWLDEGHDGAICPVVGGRLAMSCDAHVVKPLFFPGGDIGRLSVAGTVNDVAVCGAVPRYLTASFVLEEGFALSELARIVESMAATAREAGVAIVAGDTKVVERGLCDGVYISTSGVGEMITDTPPTGRSARVGDAIIVTGAIGEHGMSILSYREGMQFGTQLQSDCAPLNHAIKALYDAGITPHVLRDPTRGGVATTLNEIAQQSQVGVLLDEKAIPVPPEVMASCEFLGLDPLYVANEGKLLIIVAQEDVDRTLEVLRGCRYTEGAVKIGEVVKEEIVAPGFVEMTTLMGGRRMVDWLTGEQLPRIC